MPKPTIWTSEMDAAVIEMRGRGLSWDYISAQVFVCRSTAIERGRFLGASAPVKAEQEPIDDDRRPLPAGSNATWGAIIAGTFLEGAAYPSRRVHA